jgi:hypothetical protein
MSATVRFSIGGVWKTAVVGGVVGGCGACSAAVLPPPPHEASSARGEYQRGYAEGGQETLHTSYLNLLIAAAARPRLALNAPGL